MKKKVILISGKINSGKNLFAKYLEKKLGSKGYTTRQDLFAYNVKSYCQSDLKPLVKQLQVIKNNLNIHLNVIEKNMESYGISSKNITKDARKEIDLLSIEDKNFWEDKTDLTRTMLQLYGTDIFRGRVDDLYWVNDTKARCESYKEDFIFLTDVRFPNEIDNMYSDNYDVISIRIDRKVDTNKTIASHKSEIALDNYNNFFYNIENNLSLEDFENSADTLLNDLLSYDKIY